MFITKKHLSRRTMLRGMGAAVALPFLESMVPALTPLRKTAAAPKSRFAAIEIVHGSAGSTVYGEKHKLWSPAKEGRDFEFTKILKPLEPYREYTTIISDTDCAPADAITAEEVGADHFRSSAVFLTGVHAKQTEGSDVLNGTSIDQMYAHAYGQDTPLPSIQLSIENLDSSGTCGYHYSCVYMDTICWSSPTTPLPMTRDPRLAFEEIFGTGGSAEDRAERRRVNRSILDGITRDVARLKSDLDPVDKRRLDDYLENIREIERRIERIEAYNMMKGVEREVPTAPIGVPESWEEHVKLMYDLQVLAFAADVTRVSAFKLSRDTSNRVFPESGSETPFHTASHHQQKPSLIEDNALINRYHVKLMTHFLETLKNTPDGDGSLARPHAGALREPHGKRQHPRPQASADAPPRACVGDSSRGTSILRCPDETPQANILLTALHKLGMNVETRGRQHRTSYAV